MHVRLATTTVALSCACWTGPAFALTISGTLSPEYGAPKSIQNVQTTFEDTDHVTGFGSELDQAYGFVSEGVLYLFLAGNLSYCCPTFPSHFEQVEIFIDSKDGGQNTLRDDNANVGCCWSNPHPNSLINMSGLTFDAEFAPDYWIESTFNTAASYAELPDGAGGSGQFLG